MSKIVIGESEGKNFILPADVVTSTLVIYGGKGMGKTNLGSVLVEELSRAGLRWCALDPLGVWWGLRHSRDGKGPGIECVILGGVHGDIPIEPTGGSVAADLVVDESANVIIDFSRKPSGDMWSIGEKIRFITEYAMRLFQRQGGLTDGRRREPIFQLLDEAARYIPQIIPSGAAQLAQCVGAWETLVEEGRNVGIGVGLLTQRSARMNKSVSEVADAMFSFRIVGPNSIAAVMDWMGEHVPKSDIKRHIETLRSLDRGRCLVVSPGWLQFEGIALIRARETFDSSATPKPGERPKRVTGNAAKPDLAKYQERMKDTIERAKSEDPKELRKTIQQLKSEIAKAGKAQASPGVITRNDPRAIQLAVTAATKPLLKQIEQFQRQAKTAIDGFAKAAAPLNAIANAPAAKMEQPAHGELPKDYLRNVGRPDLSGETAFRKIPPARATAQSNGDVSSSQQRILNALAEFDSIGIHQLNKTMLAAWCQCSPTSGGYFNNLGKLRGLGLIDYPGQAVVSITEEGRKQAAPSDAPLTTDEMFSRTRSILTSSQFAILEALRHAYPEAVPKSELAEKVGASPTSGGYFNNLGKLRSSGLIDYPEQGKARVEDWMFLEGAA